MTAVPWDAAAARAVRCADAVFGSAVLSWFSRSGAGSADLWLAFDRLIRVTLAAGTSEPPPAERVLPGATPTSFQLPPAMPRHTQAAIAGTSRSLMPQRSLPDMGRQPVRVTPHHDSPQVTSARSSSTASQPAAGRASRLAALTARGFVARATITQPAKPASAPAAKPQLPGHVAPRSSTPLPRAESLPLLDAPAIAPAPGARILDFLDTSRSVAQPQPASPDTRSRGAGSPAADSPALAATRVVSAHATDPARPTRLVDGVPALQNLLHAAVAESRARQALAPIDPLAAPASAMPAPSPATSSDVAASPLRAVPLLDPVAEDMLVDRLVDRLQERLREQALRQFGFTSGLI